jgi:hypothetical protein
MASRSHWSRRRDDQSGQQIPRAKKNLHGRCYFQFHCEFVLGQTYKSALMASAQPSVVPLTQRGQLFAGAAPDLFSGHGGAAPLSVLLRATLTPDDVAIARTGLRPPLTSASEEFLWGASRNE